jgi:hypothetical protein
MTLAISDTPRTRRAYDHRLREHVVRCGAKSIAKHVQIPRSTVSTWRRRGLRPVVTTEPFDQGHARALVASAAVSEDIPNKCVRKCGTLNIIEFFAGS